jgi:hypothetical protein
VLLNRSLLSLAVMAAKLSIPTSIFLFYLYVRYEMQLTTELLLYFGNSALFGVKGTVFSFTES